MLWPFSKKSEKLLEATRSEQQDAIERLVKHGKFGSGYYMMLLLATLITTPGLLLNNVAVIIGGMILAPLMIPLLSFSMSLVSGNVRGFYRSLRILTISVVLTIATSAFLTTVFSQTYNVITWIPEQISPGIYIFIAFCSGVAGAFAWVKENLSSSTAGVAIAVSLLPPLCAAGIGLALKQYMLTQNSLVLFAANLAGICMAAFLVFWVLGFLGAGKLEEKVLDGVAEK
jgi:uncharacterized hydrophobic protein (TIGR00271 family)